MEMQISTQRNLKICEGAMKLGHTEQMERHH